MVLMLSVCMLYSPLHRSVHTSGMRAARQQGMWFRPSAIQDTMDGNSDSQESASTLVVPSRIVFRLQNCRHEVDTLFDMQQEVKLWVIGFSVE